MKSIPDYWDAFFIFKPNKFQQMRQFYFILTLLFLIVGCGSTQLTTTNPNTPGSSEEKVLVPPEKEQISSTKAEAVVLNFSGSSEVERIMEFLASDALEGRDTGSKGIEKAAEFIANIFIENDIAPYFSTYLDTLSNFDKPAYNVVGLLEGNDSVLKKEFIIIGAHYDHIGIIAPVNGDAIANGANDNASGTATVLELARYFGNAKTNKRSIIFALFSAEEKGLLGSEHLANKLKQQNLNLYTMLNFEMVGVPLVDKDYFMYVTGYELSNLAEIGNNYSGENLIGFLPSAKEFELFKRSDNYPFHKVFNVPSQTFCTFDFTNFNHYHQVGDENSLMNFEHMALLVNKTIPVLEGILNSPAKEIKYN